MFTNITHLLCGTDFDEKDIGEATDIYDIPSVTGEWVKACVRLGRLACPKVYHPIPSGLLKPIVVAISEIQPNDRKILYALITFHGGHIERNFSSKTTHLICGSASGSIFSKAMEMKSDKFSIVTPDWLYDCLNAQELINPTPYHPRLLATTNTNGPSLSDIMGTTEMKKIENTKSQISDLVARKAQNAQLAAKNMANTTMNVASSFSIVNTSFPAMVTVNSQSTSTESIQTKLAENVQSVQRNTLSQALLGQSNQLPATEQRNKEKMVWYSKD